MTPKLPAASFAMLRFFMSDATLNRLQLESSIAIIRAARPIMLKQRRQP